MPVSLGNITIEESFIVQQAGKNRKIIPINKITSITVNYTEQVWQLIVGVVMLIIGVSTLFAPNSNAAGIIMMVVGVAFILLYLLSRKHVVSVNSSTEKIQLSTVGVKPEKIDEFIINVKKSVAESSGSNG